MDCSPFHGACLKIRESKLGVVPIGTIIAANADFAGFAQRPVNGPNGQGASGGSPVEVPVDDERCCSRPAQLALPRACQWPQGTRLAIGNNQETNL